MAAYLISTIEITDPAGYEEYRKLVGPALQKYGGKFLVRGGKIHYLEGSWQPKRVVVVEFESVEKAKAFSDATEYAEAKAIRHRTSTSSVIVVEGV
ncbi:MAG TPA: DUF1330 domain-containing protein [Burkholderiales bacterium]|nr:DUF1330 domain-containing protein [Burkholderiales bacterium]